MSKERGVCKRSKEHNTTQHTHGVVAGARRSLISLHYILYSFFSFTHNTELNWNFRRFFMSGSIEQPPPLPPPQSPSLSDHSFQNSNSSVFFLFIFFFAVDDMFMKLKNTHSSSLSCIVTGGVCILGVILIDSWTLTSSKFHHHHHHHHQLITLLIYWSKNRYTSLLFLQFIILISF